MKEALIKAMEEYARQDLIVAFSGGVDSSLLLKLACKYGKARQKKVYAVTVHTFLHPIMEARQARELAENMGAVPLIIEADELKEAGIAHNPENRCYLCKKYLFGLIKKKAEELNIDTILEGTNEDDLHEYRPGIQAIRELGVISPLADAGMKKADVRQMASVYEAAVASKPSSPCLATRFPYNTPLSMDGIRRVEQAEAYLKAQGMYNVRVRVHQDIARIEVDLELASQILKQRETLVSYFKKLGYRYVTLDLEGFRSGSMDSQLLEKNVTGRQTG